MRLVPVLLALSAAIAAADPAPPTKPAWAPDGIRLGLAAGPDIVASEGAAAYRLAGPSRLALVAGLGGGVVRDDGGSDAEYATYALGSIHMDVEGLVEVGTTVRTGISSDSDHRAYTAISADAILWLAGGANWSLGATATYTWSSQHDGPSYGLVYEARPW